MNMEEQRHRRRNTMKWLENRGAVEGRDWYWGTPGDWDQFGIVDLGATVAIQESLKPRDPAALPIMIRSSGVRLIGGKLTAQKMDDGTFPDAMPFAVGVVPIATWS